MNKANGAIEKKDTYLQHVSLKNYKSIKDVEIDFKPGLNIIIGKNASGKTNFLKGLDTILNFKYDEFIESESTLRAYFNNNKIEIQATNKIQTSEDLLKGDFYYLQNHEVKLKINNEQIDVSDYESAKNELWKYKYFFNGILVKYGIHYKANAQFINLPFSFALINNGKISRELMMATIDDNRTEFIQFFFHRLYVNIVQFYGVDSKNGLPGDELKENIISFSERWFKNINDLISSYSPIQEVRVNSDFNIVKEDSGRKQTITNFYLEFLIGQNWLTFNLLSDGTKRLFYVLSEILAVYDGILLAGDELNIILLEEPELGIHPHQLHQLMQFIKEQSREKQIIITTHSPQVLDILGPDELDRIIICSNDPENGTQLNHLTEKEINKARKYIKEEAFLSDYWRFSDLEPAL